MKNVLFEALEKIKPKNEEMKLIDSELQKFLAKINSRIKKLKIDADVFVGGSFAKKTLVKKKFYDADLFLRFGKKYSESEYSKLSVKIMKPFKNISVAHGSRDYFRLKVNSRLFFEIVPVKKIKKPSEAVNITDLSYSHANYVKRKVRDGKISDGIKLAKAFAEGAGVYGAESYVSGFSGYSLELLIYHFKSFENFLKVLSKKHSGKIIVDIEKSYKNGNVLLDMNGSKLDSPIILVDPTYKARNALAALSSETYEKFRTSAAKFLKNPSVKFFEPKKIDFLAERLKAKNKKQDFIQIKISTKKESGDVAGTKLLKFFNFASSEIGKYFYVMKKDFEYGGEKTGQGYFILKSRREIILNGPSADDKKNATRFKKEHGKVFEKKGKIYSIKKINFSGREFLSRWLSANKRKVKEMSISGVEIY